MIAAPRFSIVIPAHNEAARIERTIREYARAFRDSEVIVVLNGCTDETARLIRRLAPAYPGLRVVEIAGAVGKGGAVRAGMLVAEGPIVGYVDADCATSAREMRRLCESLGADDALIASRWLRGAVVDVPQPLQRRAASRLFNCIVRILFRLPFTDTQCGAKVFRAASLEQILPHVETANYAFDVDILLLMRRAGMRIREAPTIWRDVIGSQVRLIPAAARMLAALLRLRLRHSALRRLLPFFDRVLRAETIQSHFRLNVLLVSWKTRCGPSNAKQYADGLVRRWADAGHPACVLRTRLDAAGEIADETPVAQLRESRTSFALLLGDWASAGPPWRQRPRLDGVANHQRTRRSSQQGVAGSSWPR